MRLSDEQKQLLDGLPGGDLIAAGLGQIAEGNLTAIESLLVFLAIPRMSASGFPELNEKSRHAPDEIERKLYKSLTKHDDPYGEYNALKRRLGRFLSALEGRWRRENSVVAREK